MPEGASSAAGNVTRAADSFGEPRRRLRYAAADRAP